MGGRAAGYHVFQYVAEPGAQVLAFKSAPVLAT